MLLELILRFVIGGLVVSAFAVIGDVLRPKTFAGIFGAAPSVALATLGLTFFLKGGVYAGTEGRSMVIGAIAFIAYSVVVGYVLIRWEPSSLVTASAGWLVWAAVAFGVWGLFLA
jgi:hypothetical protein